jgi:redox-sensitive bicupin YhaK (pirin superfamily)
MITLRRATERRHVQRGNQDSWLTFFPGGGHDSRAVAFGVLDTFDELQLPPGGSSGFHRLADAEILTYVCTGTLALEDSGGRSGLIQAGEFQRMTTRHRTSHNETNASRTDCVRVFRIALRHSPSDLGANRVHEQRRFTAAQRRNVLCVVASRDGRKGSLRFHQDALIYSSLFDPGHHLVYELLPGRSAWLHIVYGQATLKDISLTQGDGVGITIEPSVSLTIQDNTEILLVDLGPAPNSFDS